MKILITDKSNLAGNFFKQKELFENNYNCISITPFNYVFNYHFEEDSPIFECFRKKTLYLKFDNIESIPNKKEKEEEIEINENDYKLFSEEDANSIIKFLNKTFKKGRDLILQLPDNEYTLAKALIDPINNLVNKYLSDNIYDFYKGITDTNEDKYVYNMNNYIFNILNSKIESKYNKQYNNELK